MNDRVSVSGFSLWSSPHRRTPFLSIHSSSPIRPSYPSHLITSTPTKKEYVSIYLSIYLSIFLNLKAESLSAPRDWDLRVGFLIIGFCSLSLPRTSISLFLWSVSLFFPLLCVCVCVCVCLESVRLPHEKTGREAFFFAFSVPRGGPITLLYFTLLHFAWLGFTWLYVRLDIYPPSTTFFPGTGLRSAGTSDGGRRWGMEWNAKV